MFYVYEYFNIETGEVFFVCAGSKNRLFDDGQLNNKIRRMISLHTTVVRVYKNNLTREEAIQVESELHEEGEAQYNKENKRIIPTYSEETRTKKSIIGQKKAFHSSAVHRPEVKSSISNTLKGRNTSDEYWLIKLFKDSEISFNNHQDVAEYFGVSKSLVSDWKYGTISSRWKRHIKKVQIVRKEKMKV